DDIPSASFAYVTDDVETVHRGLDSFRAAVPYLFATCERLGRVTFNTQGGAPEIWDAETIMSRTVDDVLVRERLVSFRNEDRHIEYRVVRVAFARTPTACAIAVLRSSSEERWQVLVPGHEFPRVFRRYPIRSSSFLPLTAVLDAPFDLDQERRRILLDKDEV